MGSLEYRHNALVESLVAAIPSIRIHFVSPRTPAVNSAL